MSERPTQTERKRESLFKKQCMKQEKTSPPCRRHRRRTPALGLFCSAFFSLFLEDFRPRARRPGFPLLFTRSFLFHSKKLIFLFLLLVLFSFSFSLPFSSSSLLSLLFFFSSFSFSFLPPPSTPPLPTPLPPLFLLFSQSYPLLLPLSSSLPPHPHPHAYPHLPTSISIPTATPTPISTSTPTSSTSLSSLALIPTSGLPSPSLSGAQQLRHEAVSRLILPCCSPLPCLSPSFVTPLSFHVRPLAPLPVSCPSCFSLFPVGLANYAALH